MTTNPQTDRPKVDDPRVLALAKARQHRAHSNPFNAGFCPPWDGLTKQEQHLSLLDARNYLHAALDAGLVPAVSVSAAAPPTDRAADVAEACRKFPLPARAALITYAATTRTVTADALAPLLDAHEAEAEATALRRAADEAEKVAESLRAHHEFERSTGALDVMSELRRLAAEAPEPATQAEAPGGSPRPVIEHALTAYGYSPDIARTLIDRLTAEQGDQ